MLNKLLTGLFGSRNQRLLNQLKGSVARINALEEQIGSHLSHLVHRLTHHRQRTHTTRKAGQNVYASHRVVPRTAHFPARLESESAAGVAVACDEAE